MFCFVYMFGESGYECVLNFIRCVESFMFWMNVELFMNRILESSISNVIFLYPYTD